MCLIVRFIFSSVKKKKKKYIYAAFQAADN